MNITAVLRALAWLAGAVVLMVGGAVLWFSLVFDPEDYRDDITAWVSAQTGRTLALNGPVSLVLGLDGGSSLLARIEMDELALSSSPGSAAPDPNMIRLRRLAFSIDLLALLRGKVVPREVVFEQPQIRLLRTAEGNNWSDLAGGVALIAAQGLSIKDGLIKFEDVTNGRSLRLAAVTVSTQPLVAGQESALALNAVLEREPDGPALEVALTATALLDAEATAVAFKALTAQIGHTTVTGRLDLALVNAQPHWQFDLAVDQLDLGVAALTLPALSLAGVDADGSVRIARLFFGGLTMEEVSVPVSARQGILVSSPVTAVFYGGEARGDIFLDTRDQGLVVRVRQLYRDCQLGDLFTGLGLGDALAATGNLNIHFAASGLDESRWLQTARGVIRLQAREGHIRGIDIESLLKQLQKQANQNLGTWLGSTAVTPFSGINATLRMEQGLVVNEDLDFEAAGLNLRGRGSVSLRNQQVDYRISVGFDDPELAALLPLPSNMATLVLPLRLFGAVQQPKLVIDIPELMRMQIEAAMGASSVPQAPPVDERARKLEQALAGELDAALAAAH